MRHICRKSRAAGAASVAAGKVDDVELSWSSERWRGSSAFVGRISGASRSCDREQMGTPDEGRVMGRTQVTFCERGHAAVEGTYRQRRVMRDGGCFGARRTRARPDTIRPNETAVLMTMRGTNLSNRRLPSRNTLGVDRALATPQSSWSRIIKMRHELRSGRTACLCHSGFRSGGGGDSAELFARWARGQRNIGEPQTAAFRQRGRARSLTST